MFNDFCFGLGCAKPSGHTVVLQRRPIRSTERTTVGLRSGGSARRERRDGAERLQVGWEKKASDGHLDGLLRDAWRRR